MAKKKGDGKNLGLIITLVFFVLTTVILGVTTYMGFSDQETKEAAKKEAEKQKLVADADKDYYRMQGSRPPALDRPPGRRRRGGGDRRGEAEVRRRPVPAGGEPEGQGGGRQGLQDAQRGHALGRQGRDAHADLRAAPRQAQRGSGRLEGQDEEGRGGHQEGRGRQEGRRGRQGQGDRRAQEVLRRLQRECRWRIEEGPRGDRREAVHRRGRGQEAGRPDAAEGRSHGQARETREAIQGPSRRLLVDANKQKKDALERQSEAETKLSALSEKAGVDPRAVEAATLDASARKVLDAWSKSWSIVDLDRRGDNAYISIGSNDQLTPQVTFSVHAVGPNGKLNPNPKGTVEVVRILGGNPARLYPGDRPSSWFGGRHPEAR